MRIIGVYNADGGLKGELSYFFGHLMGTTQCSLCDITHSPVAKKAQWKHMEQQLHQELGVEFLLVHKNERSPEQLAASEGKEPCVLLEDDDGTLSVLLDGDELQQAEGDVAAFERALRSKLLTPQA